MAKGAHLVKRGLLSVDYPVRRLLVVQMGDDPEVTRSLKECQRLLPNLHVVNGLGNLGCAAGRNRVILEDLNADYWFILGFDISFPPGVLGRIHRETTDLFAKQPRVGIVHFWYQWGAFKPEWSAIVVRKEVVHDVGFFDENIWPVNTEDEEYKQRLNGNSQREPWYRHLMPTTTRDRACPDFYVEHGVAFGESGTMKQIRSMATEEHAYCKKSAAAYNSWQQRRQFVAYASNKWGRHLGSRYDVPRV